MATFQGNTDDITSTANRLALLATDIKTSIDTAKQAVTNMNFQGEAADSVRAFHLELDTQANAIQLTFEEFAKGVGLSATAIEDTLGGIGSSFGGSR